MKERILEFLKAENKSSAQFAEEIGVQPSGISHILSGRNKPSLDFVLKMLEKYSDLSVEWLLFGKGGMYNEIRMPTLFDDNNAQAGDYGLKGDDKAAKEGVDWRELKAAGEGTGGSGVKAGPGGSDVRRIIILHGDNSFEEYFPR